MRAKHPALALGSTIALDELGPLRPLFHFIRGDMFTCEHESLQTWDLDLFSTSLSSEDARERRRHSGPGDILTDHEPRRVEKPFIIRGHAETASVHEGQKNLGNNEVKCPW